MKKIFIILIMIIMVIGCDKNVDINKLMQENEYIIIDVRTKQEYNQEHLKGAINIPYDELDDTIDKNKILFVYCKSGTRSQIAFETLTNLGYEVYDLGAFSQIDLPKE